MKKKELMFRTEFEIQGAENKISTESNVMFFGSCFTENIGSKFKELHLTNIVNPFGILYNPASVAKNIRNLINSRLVTADDLVLNNEKWVSYNHHGRFSNIEKQTCLDNINSEIGAASLLLKQADTLYITFGTSWVYKLKEDKSIVANCHKFAASNFIRERLSINEIVNDYSKLIQEIRAINKDINIVFTVSPIRHWKDGANGNQLSKSILLLAIDEIVKQNSNCFYFPSYEIVMDDLRDYRFYSSDMFHINETAINYIWDKFKDTFFDSSLNNFEKRVVKINAALNHRTDDNTNEKYIDFINLNIKKSKDLETEFKIDLSDLRKKLEAKL